MYQNILVPVDGSDTSRAGLLEAMKLAQDSGATVRTHGRRGLGRVVLGSEAEYVVRHTPVPVLLVRNQ
jgi:nucleotide-binding universal stress UspA family protein